MKTIIRDRETGKARQLIEFAAAEDATIAAENPDAFRVKALNYGYPNIKIISWEDVMVNIEEPLPDKLIIHNMDKMMYWWLGNHLIGFSATLEK